MENEIRITHLSWRPLLSRASVVPYIRVNCTFRIDRKNPLFQRALSLSQPSYKTLAAENRQDSDSLSNLKKVWALQDPSWVYLSKFDTFWLSQLISDCSVTRSCLEELEHFRKEGKLPDVHRFTNESVIIRHLRTLDFYWD